MGSLLRTYFSSYFNLKDFDPCDQCFGSREGEILSCDYLP